MPSTTTTPSTTTPSTSTNSPLPIRLSGDYIRRPSEEFLLYIKQVEERKREERLEQFLNRPVVTLHTEEREESPASPLSNSVLLAVLVSVIIVVSILAITLLVFTLRRKRTTVIKAEEENSDSESTTSTSSSTSTYLQYSVQGSDYSYVMGSDGRIYQVISQYRPSSQIRSSDLRASIGTLKTSGGPLRGTIGPLRGTLGPLKTPGPSSLTYDGQNNDYEDVDKI